jgi:hypothetical protein
MLPQWKWNTHTDLIASGQAGKTSALIYGGRRHILGDNQIVRQAWKADLYQADVAFTAFANPDYKVVLLNPSEGSPNVPYNPFKLYGDLSTHVENLSKAIVENVSSDRNRDVPTYAEAAEPFFAYLALTGETPFTSIRFFDVANAKEWGRAAEKIPEPYASTFRRIGGLKGKEFEQQTGTLRRRLRPFINSTGLRRFTSSPKGVNIHQLLKDGYSIFFNGAPSGFLSLEAARVINGIFLSELMRFGIENATKKRKVTVFTDEIQEFQPADFASSIDLVLGAGLRFVLVHHHAEQFPERLRMSVETNARIKILGGGLSPEVLRHYAEIAYAREINQDMHRQPQIGHVMEYEEEEVESITTTDHSEAVTLGTRLRGEAMEVQTGWDDYSREHKVSIYAERLKVPDRTFIAILPGGLVEQFTIPTLKRYLYNSETCLKFIETHPFATNEPERSLNASTRTRPKKPGLFHAE